MMAVDGMADIDDVTAALEAVLARLKHGRQPSPA